MITREEAALIALAHVRAVRSRTSGVVADAHRDVVEPSIAYVLDLTEVSRPPMPYGLRESLASCWIVYLTPRGLMLGPSEIVLVTKTTGDVVYYGSAGDEG